MLTVAPTAKAEGLVVTDTEGLVITDPYVALYFLGVLVGVYDIPTTSEDIIEWRGSLSTAVIDTLETNLEQTLGESTLFNIYANRIEANPQIISALELIYGEENPLIIDYNTTFPETRRTLIVPQDSIYFEPQTGRTTDLWDNVRAEITVSGNQRTVRYIAITSWGMNTTLNKFESKLTTAHSTAGGGTTTLTANQRGNTDFTEENPALELNYIQTYYDINEQQIGRRYNVNSGVIVGQEIDGTPIFQKIQGNGPYIDIYKAEETKISPHSTTTAQEVEEAGEQANEQSKNVGIYIPRAQREDWKQIIEQIAEHEDNRESVAEEITKLADKIKEIGEQVIAEPISGETESSWIQQIGEWIRSIPTSIQNATEGIRQKIDQVIETITDTANPIIEVPNAINNAWNSLITGLGNLKLQITSIWHYVVEWMQSISAGSGQIRAIWSALPYAMVVPIYATLVIVIIYAIAKFFF